MIRVLQLLIEPTDFQTERGSAALLRGLGAEFEVVQHRIGRGCDHRNIAAAALHLRKLPDRFDAIHAWGISAATAAIFGAQTPLVFSPTGFLSRRAVAWLRAATAYRRIEIVCPTATQRRVCVERGIAVDRCHLIRPGVDFSRVRRRRDPALRRALGLSESDHVLLIPGESTEAAAHEQGVWAASIPGVLDEKYKVLLWGRGSRAARAAAMGENLGQRDLVRVAETRLGRRMEFEELLPAADTILISARGPVATLPIAICMAAALPIVATVTYTVAELLEDRHTAVLAPKNKPQLLARRFLELEQDRGLQWSIADMARTEAYEYFAQTRFINDFRELFRQLAAGNPIAIPEHAPGAGMRFHGLR
jgi:glycosyltransferase involved in cell wall biosynthesis